MIITLRQADFVDLGVIHAIRRKAILGIKSARLTEGDRLNWVDRRSSEFFADRVESGEVVIAVCETNAVGWGSISGDRVTGLYVLPTVGSRGVGRNILSDLESRILQQRHVFAGVESSPNAVGFYAGLGYVTVGPPNDDAAISMRKALIQPRVV